MFIREDLSHLTYVNLLEISNSRTEDIYVFVKEINFHNHTSYFITFENLTKTSLGILERQCPPTTIIKRSNARSYRYNIQIQQHHIQKAQIYKQQTKITRPFILPPPSPNLSFFPLLSTPLLALLLSIVLFPPSHTLPNLLPNPNHLPIQRLSNPHQRLRKEEQSQHRDGHDNRKRIPIIFRRVDTFQLGYLDREICGHEGDGEEKDGEFGEERGGAC